jgi:hypothetical protein
MPLTYQDINSELYPLFFGKYFNAGVFFEGTTPLVDGVDNKSKREILGCDKYY